MQKSFGSELIYIILQKCFELSVTQSRQANESHSKEDSYTLILNQTKSEPGYPNSQQEYRHLLGSEISKIIIFRDSRQIWDSLSETFFEILEKSNNSRGSRDSQRIQ